MQLRFGRFSVAVTTVIAAVILCVVGAIAVLKPGPEGKIVIATGGSGGAFRELAEVYRAALVQYGIKLELRPEVEGTETLKALLSQYRDDFKSFNPKTSDITAGFVKGGFASSLQGRYANGLQKVWHQRQTNDLRSLGRMFYEPMWVFSRAEEPIKSLRDLKGRKIMIGAPTSGNRSIASHLLMANGVQPDNSTLIQEDAPDDGSALSNGTADAAILVLPPDAPKIQKLLRNRKVRLMDFSAEAEAYIFRFPAFSKVILRQGAIEFNPDTPAADITLLATEVAMIVRADLNPSLQTLLARVVAANPKTGFDNTGEPILFYKAGEFPTVNDPEFIVPPSVQQLYKSGELPTLLRGGSLALARLHLPFWPAAFLNEHGTQTALIIIPALSILLPLFHYLPIVYRWGIRQRLLRRYQQLKAIEASIDDEATQADVAESLDALEHIDTAVSRISVPLPFSDQLYDLRGHIDLVRRRLELKAQALSSPDGQRA